MGKNAVFVGLDVTILFLGGPRKTENHDPHIAQQEIADIQSLSA